MSQPSATRPQPSPTAPEPTPQEVVGRMMIGAWVTQALRAAVELGLADELAAGPRSAADLARACGALPDRLERLLRALAGEGVFHCRDDGRYENTPTSATLRTDVAESLAATLRMTGDEHYLGWHAFPGCLRAEKTAFELHFGAPVFEWYARRPDQAANFQRAMSEYSAPQVPAIVAAFDPARFTRIVDVGGGHGALLAGLLARAPRARGVVFDLEQGLAAARAHGLDRDPRIELVPGDFFESVAPGGDLYVLKFILHDWSDEQCATILRHVRAGLAPGGRVLVAEHLVGPPNRSDPAKWMDLHMMAMPGGRERTAEEFEALFARAGLRTTRVVPTTAGLFLIEAEAAG